MDKKNTLYLRAQLIKIWTIKNLKLFILSGCLIFLILIATGVFPVAFVEKIPILNIFLVDIQEGMKNINQGGWISIILSLSTVFTIFSNKARSVKLPDISTTELKYMLVKAGLKFDVNGNICLFSENNEKIENETYVQRLFRAFRELKIILTAKITDDTDFKQIIKEQNMESAKETADKISNVTASLEIQDVEIKDGKKTTKIFSVVLKLRDAVMKVLNWLKSKFTIKEEIVEGWGDDNTEAKPPVEESKEETKEEVIINSEPDPIIIDDGSVIIGDEQPTTKQTVTAPTQTTAKEPTPQPVPEQRSYSAVDRLKNKSRR